MVELKLPKYLQKYFGALEIETDLIDGCKYVLYFAKGYAFNGEYSNVPVRSKKEAIEYLKSAYPKESD